MLLKRIELSGFKSFARPTILAFETSVTAIVGPNGSGKSNVVEAVRFILGEQSMKSLRSKRGEDLIFNGSRTTPRLNAARAVLVFDNRSKIFDLDYEEVLIERVIHRDGASEYRLNGSLVRLRDIIERMAGLHIGPSGHHIISQGQADHILNALPPERKEMIEDALGLKLYHFKKKESERKLQKTREHVAQVRALRKELAPHLKFLEAQAQRIARVEELRETLKVLYEEYFAQERAYLVHRESEISGEENPARKELEELEHRLLSAEELFKDIPQKRELETQLRILEKNLALARAKKDSLSRTIGRIEGMIDIRSREREKLRTKTDSATLSIEASRFNEAKKVIDFIIERANSSASREIVSELFEELKNAVRAFFAFFGGEREDALTEYAQEITRLSEEREKALSDFSVIEKEEQIIDAERRKLSLTIEGERVSRQEEERNLFLVRGRRSELVSKLELVAVRREQFIREKEQCAREQDEARAIVGVDFGSLKFAVRDEDRSVQELRRKKLERLKIRIEESGGGSSSDILKEYDEMKERDAFLERELADLEKSADALSALIDDLAEKIHSEFLDGIKKINEQFNEFFGLMFKGGKASIKIVSLSAHRKLKSDNAKLIEMEEGLSEEEAEAEEGIEIAIDLPVKRIKSLHALSGGEKTLASMAFIFAIAQVNPPPFLILDETDAALDEANSLVYGSLLERIAQTTQLIIVTHNRMTMARAGVLYGVTMAGDGVSHVLSVRLQEAAELAKS